METVKAREAFLEPDPRSASFTNIDSQTDRIVPMVLDDMYDMAKHFRVHEGVPEDVRSYMASVTTLWLYGWLYYPFYSLAQFLSTTAIEMALKERLSQQAGRKRRGLKHLLRVAKSQGLLRNEEFPWLERAREHEAQLEEELSEIGIPRPESAPTPYVETLIASLPSLRNSWAHPKMHSIMPPGAVVDMMVLAATIINQLWQDPQAPTP